ncbi:MAG: hypothetical protein AABZ39_14505 [Spirochaetota bacterium]
MRSRIVAVLFFCGSIAHPYVGASALEFMNIDMCAVSSSFGGAGSASSGTIEGVYKNPSSITGLPTAFSVYGSYALYVLDSLYSGAFAYQFENGIVLAFGTKGIFYNAIEAGIPYTSGFSTNLGAFDLYAAGAIALPLGDMLSLPIGFSVGATLGYALEVLDTTAIHAFVASVGGVAFFVERKLTAGVTIKNIGIGGTDAETILPPLEILLGAGYTWDVIDALSLKGLLDIDALSFAQGGIPTVRAGVEVLIMKFAAVRLGCVYADSQFDITAGAGAKFSLTAGAPFSVDYSFSTATWIGMRHTLSMSYSFGDIRGQKTTR